MPATRASARCRAAGAPPEGRRPRRSPVTARRRNTRSSAWSTIPRRGCSACAGCSWKPAAARTTWPPVPMRPRPRASLPSVTWPTRPCWRRNAPMAIGAAPSRRWSAVPPSVSSRRGSPGRQRAAFSPPQRRPARPASPKRRRSALSMRSSSRPISSRPPASPTPARRRGDLRKAAKIVEAAWRANPHPDLAKVYLGLRVGDSGARPARPGRNPRQDFHLAPRSPGSPWRRPPWRRRNSARPAKRWRPFSPSVRPSAPASPWRRSKRPSTVREQAGHANGWPRPPHAPRDPMWIADGIASERWAPVSPVTGHLDAFVWKAPTELLEGPSSDDVTGDLVDKDDRSQPALAPALQGSEMPAPVPAPVAAPGETRRTPAGERRRDGVETLRAGHGSDGTRCRDPGGVPPRRRVPIHV